MNDTCKAIRINNVKVQENGIIRHSSGYPIGRLSNDVSFDFLLSLKKYLQDESENIQHGLHNLSHTNKNGKYGDIMPSDECDIGRTKE